MGRHLIVDRTACAGHGICYGTAPELLDCDDQGEPVVMADPIADDQVEQARAVVRSCPERALRLGDT